MSDYVRLKKLFDETFLNYTNNKEEYYKHIKIMNKEFHYLNEKLNKDLNSNQVLLNNFNVLFEEYVNSLEEELDINGLYDNLNEVTDELISEINSIENLYYSSKIHFINDNDNFIVFLLIKDLMEIPIEINNVTYIFHEDLKEKISKKELL